MMMAQEQAILTARMRFDQMVAQARQAAAEGRAEEEN